MSFATLLRFGQLGHDVLAPDDDVVLVIAPQNVIGASVLDVLEATVKAANGRPLILLNPLLG